MMLHSIRCGVTQGAQRFTPLLGSGLILVGLLLVSTALRSASGPGESLLATRSSMLPPHMEASPTDVLLMPSAPVTGPRRAEGPIVLPPTTRKAPPAVATVTRRVPPPQPATENQPGPTPTAAATVPSATAAVAGESLRVRLAAPTGVPKDNAAMPTVAATATALLPAATAAPLALTPTAVPAPDSLPPTARVVIPRIGVDARVQDVGVTLEGQMGTVVQAVGRLALSAQAGEVGNVVLAAHNDVGGEVFRRLTELRAGDEILLYRGRQEFRYRVGLHTIVREEGVPLARRRQNAQWMAPTNNASATLITCWPYGIDTHRVIVRATLEQSTV